MHRSFPKTIGLLAALIMAAVTAGAAGSTNSDSNVFDLFADQIVAQGKGVKVTRAMLDESLVSIRAAAAARGDMLPPRQMQVLEAQVLGRLIGMQILNQDATEEDRAKGAENAAQALQGMKKTAGTPEAFARQLKTVGMTEAELLKKLTAEATAEAILQRKITFEVTDADVKKFYDDNPTQFEIPERVHVAQILFSAVEPDGTPMSADKKKAQQELAEKVDKQARAGGDFAALAREYSDDMSSRDKGGDKGMISRGLPQIPPDFEAAAFSLGTNEVSDVVTTPYGYHIIKVLEKLPAKTETYEEAAPKIKKFLEHRGIMKQIPAFMKKLEQKAGVEILDKDIKKLRDQMDAAAAADMEKADEPGPDAKKSQ